VTSNTPRRRRLSLLTSFGLSSLLLVVGLGVVLGKRLSDSVHDRTLADAVRLAQVAGDVGVRSQLHPDDLKRGFVPLDTARVTQLQAELGRAISPDGVVRIKVWNTEHWIVYSDNERLVGRWFASDEGLADALDGRTRSQITDLSGPEELDDRDLGRLLSVYAPLRVGSDGEFTSDPDGRVVGAFEIYLPYEPLATAIAHDRLRLLLTLGVGSLILYLALFRLVAAASRRLRRQSQENHHQALHDQLTGLPNRVLLDDRIEQAVRAANRSGLSGAVMLVDLDRFKEINDTLGHGSGDAVLRQVGERLRQRLRDVDTVARLGGDEFALVIGDLPLGTDVVVLGREIEHLLTAPFDVDGLELDLRGSIGVVVFPDDGEEAETLLRRADVAMYVAKRTHSRCQAYSAAIDQYSPDRLALANQARTGLDNDEFVVFYQPTFDLKKQLVTGVEALVRWQHPTRGLLPPVEFLPILENTELMPPLTLRVLDRALAQARRWADAGLELTIAVNLSARGAGDHELPATIRRLLAQHGVNPQRLELELTESAVLDDPDRARQVLVELHDLGVRIAIDDFGTGYASLAYLTTLPVDCLKVDRSFVMDLVNEGSGAPIVRFTVELGRSLGLTVVAEGVEDAATLARLGEIGCDEAQGYYLTRPLPAAELDTWFAQSPFPPAHSTVGTTERAAS
jgi:diguanylate cyclase (GGDEF)-like protein